MLLSIFLIFVIIHNILFYSKSKQIHNVFGCFFNMQNMHGKIHECFLSNSSILTIGNWSVPRKYCPIICCPVLAAIYAHYHIMYIRVSKVVADHADLLTQSRYKKLSKLRENIFLIRAILNYFHSLQFSDFQSKFSMSKIDFFSFSFFFFIEEY